MEKSRIENLGACNLPGEEERREVDMCCFICPNVSSFSGTFHGFFDGDCSPPTFPCPYTIQVAAIRTIMVTHCDPILWLEFLGPAVGFDPSLLIIMHQWESGIRIELLQL